MSDTNVMKDKLDESMEMFGLAADAERENREIALRDIKFSRLSDQWPQDIKDKRDAQKRPCLTINKLPSFIRQVVNDARQNKPSISIHPVDSGADPHTAEVLSGLIRNIEYTSDADIAYDNAAEQAVTGGWGYWRVNVDYADNDTFDLDLMIKPIMNVFSVYGDHFSTSADSSDWNSAFVTDMMPLKVFKKKYKGADLTNWEDDYKHLPGPWAEQEMIMLAEHWIRSLEDGVIVKLSDGRIMDADIYKANKDTFDIIGLSVVADRRVKRFKVMQRIMSGAEILEENPWKGKFIPIVPVYGIDINVEGVRHLRGMIHDAIDSQMMFNYWRTASTELVALAPKAPYIGPVGAFMTDEEKWANANTESYSYIEYDGPQAPQRQPFAGVPAGALQEALNASDDMKAIIGIYDAGLGARSNETSGIAIRARQLESDTSTFHFIDNLSRAIRHTGRILVDLIPHVYTGERIVRVLGAEGVKDAKTVPLNTPTKLPDGTDHIYDLSVGKYDVVVTSGPSFTTRRQEAAQQMIEMLRAFPQAAQVVGDLLAKNLDWPGAEEIAERLRKMLPPEIREEGENELPPEHMAQMQQMQQMIEQGMQLIQQQKQELDALKTDKSIEAKKLEVDQYNAETNRIKATMTGMTPEQIHALVMQTIIQVLNSPDILAQPPVSPQIPLDRPDVQSIYPQEGV